MVKRPRLPEHVKRARSRGREYLYFNTGKKNANGNPIRVPLPPLSSPSFWPKYAGLKAARDRAPKQVYTVASACDAYEASTDWADKADSTKKLYGYALRIIREALGAFPIDAVKRSHIQKVLDKGLPSPSMHDPFLAVLGVVYRQARRDEKTTLFPTRDFDKREGGTHEPWPEAVLEAGLASDHDRTRLAVHLLFFTGQRIGDVCKMRWSDVRDDEIQVIQQKTGKALWIPMLGELRAELERTPKRGLTIITDQSGAQMTPQYIRKELKRHGDAMGVEVVPHGLRKNAVISLLEAGCSVYEVMAITGQSQNIVAQYAEGRNQRKLAGSAVVKFQAKRNKLPKALDG
jgi:integrase